MRLGSVKVLVDAGVVRPMRPDRLWTVLRTLQRWGRSPAAGTISLAARFPDDAVIVDELGTLTHSEVHERTNALAHALSDAGILEGDGVGIMCRNHRGFIEATVAVSKLGADALYLNTAFAGPQLAEVVGRRSRRRSSTTRSSGSCSRRPAQAQALRGLARIRVVQGPDARRADRRRATVPRWCRPSARAGRSS